jgi:hypothetical protein
VRSFSLRPDDLLTIPWVALSIDSMCFVSSANAILATGSDSYPGGLNLPLNTSAFFWTCDWVSRSLLAGEFEVVIMIESVTEEMHGSD